MADQRVVLRPETVAALRRLVARAGQLEDEDRRVECLEAIVLVLDSALETS